MRTCNDIGALMFLAGLVMFLAGCVQPLGRLNGDAAQPWDIESEHDLLVSVNAGAAADQRHASVCGVFYGIGRHGRVALAQYGQVAGTDLHEFCHSVDHHGGDWWAAYRVAQPTVASADWRPIAARLEVFCQQCDGAAGPLPHWRTLRARFGAEALGGHRAIINALGND